MRKRTPESYVLNAVMEYLAAKRIFAIRMNSGAVKLDNRFLRFGSPGMADVLAIQQCQGYGAYETFTKTKVYWLECKALGGRQSELQKAFQNRVEAEGHIYILARGIEDLQAAGL